MRLSDKRIEHLAWKMAKKMVAHKAVEPHSGTQDLAQFIARFLAYDQMKEQQIEEEAREFIARQRTLPPPGTGEYEAAFNEAKRRIARNKGRIL